MSDATPAQPPRRRRNPPRNLRVIRNELLTPHMRRVTLGGEEMAGFPTGRESANFKLVLPSDGDDRVVRTYTVRNFDETKQEVDVDFFIHLDAGPASQWAVDAAPGDSVGFMGPGSDKLAAQDRDWFLFAGDMSALPAIGANIERLPADARGYALLEVVDLEDKQNLPFPEAMSVQWIVNPHPEQPNTLLFDAVREIEWLDGSPAVWVAGESNAVRAIRNYLRDERDVGREDRYCSGYWQIGLTEDRHQQVKRQEGDD